LLAGRKWSELEPIPTKAKNYGFLYFFLFSGHQALRDERKIGDDEGWESLSLSSFYQENRVLGSRAAGGVLHSLSFLYSGILVRKTPPDDFYSS